MREYPSEAVIGSQPQALRNFLAIPRSSRAGAGSFLPQAAGDLFPGLGVEHEELFETVGIIGCRSRKPRSVSVAELAERTTLMQNAVDDRLVSPAHSQKGPPMFKLVVACTLTLSFACSSDTSKSNNESDASTPFEDAERANAEWDEYVATHNTCETADDCVVIPTGCEISCYDAVASDSEEEALAEAARVKELAREANQDCAACGPAGEPRCEENVCVLE